MSFVLARRIWMIFAVALALKSFIQPGIHSLFPCFSTASEHWWKGWSLFDRKVMPHDFRYSPVFAILFTPFTLLPSPWGELFWSELNLASFWWALNTLYVSLLPETADDRRRGWFVTLALLGTGRSIWPGQCNLLILSSAIASLALIRRNQYWAAGFFLASPIFIKVWPGAFALLCLTITPRNIIFPLIGWIVILAAFPFATQTSFYVRSEYHEWYLALIGPISVRISNYDAWAIWELIAPPVEPLGYLVLQISSGFLLAVAVFLMGRSSSQIRERYTFLLWGWTSWQVFFGPGVERLTLAIASPLSAWIVLSTRSNRCARTSAVTGFLLTQLACNVNLERGFWNIPLWNVLHPVGILMLWGAYLIGNVTSKRISLVHD